VGITPITDLAVLEADMYDELTANIAANPVEFEFVPFDFELFNMKPVDNDAQETILNKLWNNYNYKYTFHANGEDSFTFQMEESEILDGRNLRIEITDSEFLVDEFLFEESFTDQPLVNGRRSITIDDLRPNTIYTMTLSGRGKMILPQNFVVRQNSARKPSGGAKNTYFIYIPLGAEEIVWSGWLSTGKTAFDVEESYFSKPNGDGTFTKVPIAEVYSETVLGNGTRNGTYITPVYEKDENGNIIWDGRGKLWKMRQRIYRWNVINFTECVSEKIFDYDENLSQ